MRHHRPSFLRSSLYLLLSTVTLVLSATRPNPSESPSTNSSDLTAAGSKIQCLATIPFSPFFLTQHKCAEAIHDLSDGVRPGRFHNGEPWDEWSLPISHSSGYCKVTVSMAIASNSETASWLQVKLAATQLNLACASKYKTRYAGGTVSTGSRNDINVTIDWNQNRETLNDTLETMGAIADA